jgi:hypothetical protein
MSVKNVFAKLALGFLHPSLFPAYVLIATLSGIVFASFYFGYGCWYRIGGILFLVFVPIAFISLLSVICAGRLQRLIWSRLLGQPNTGENEMPLHEVFWRSCVVAIIIPILCAEAGGQFPASRAQKICDDTTPLIGEIQKTKRLLGAYPTNAADLVKSDSVLRRRYCFYYGEPSTNGVDWTVDKIVAAHVSLFVTTNSFQFVVPIEKISPVSFSSFYVFSCSSECPTWKKVLLHWSPIGAHIDPPCQ